MADATSLADRPVDEIESLCMNCHENGTTRLLLTRIPFFKEIVLTSFHCAHCGFKNTEIQSAGEIQQQGVRITFKTEKLEDLQRQVVKGDNCVVRLEEIDLEIPAGRGQLSNIEGLISMVKDDLESKQGERKEVDEALYKKVQDVIDLLASMVGGDRFPFTITIDDLSGNSSLEPNPADSSGKYVRTLYARTEEQNAALGLGDSATGSAPTADTGQDAPPPSSRPEYHAANMVGGTTAEEIANQLDENDEIIEDQVYSFPTPCPGCSHPTTTNMKMVRIPHFKEIVIMSTNCAACGYRSNEVKTGGTVPDKGSKITLDVQTREDLSRDILKGESCALSCPELNLNVEPGTLGGRFTTVEGLLTQVRDDLKSSIFDTDDDNNNQGAQTTQSATDKPVLMGGLKGGDSMASDERAKWKAFFDVLDEAINGERPFSVILQDPLAGSYVQSLAEDGTGESDPQIKIEEYERTEEEEEHLGLRDIQTDGYEEKHEEQEIDNEGGASDKEPIDTDEILKAVQEKMQRFNADEEGGR